MQIENPQEIKLIVSDIDGTLLPYEHKVMPEEIYSLIEAVTAKGIRFMIASGRDAGSIKELFAPVQDKISYISGNGAIYVEGEEVLFTQPFQQEYIRAFLDSLVGDMNLLPVIMTEKEYYIVIDGSENAIRMKREIARLKAGVPYVEVASSQDIKETICKLGVFQKRILEQEEVQQLRDKWPKLELVCGGGQWLDVTQQGTNKGSAIAKILDIYGLTTDNLMTFGDNENDLQMLEMAKYGYAVRTATPIAKQAAAFECESVLEVLKELLAGEKKV